MSDRLLLLLPALCEPADATVHWWRISDEAVVEHGSDCAWRDLVSPLTGPALPLVALAPVASVRLAWPEPDGATEKQRLGVAKAMALQQGMADPSTLHAVADLPEGRLCVALVANGSMVEWLDWLAAKGVDPLAIIPSGLLLEASEEWTGAVLGSERMIRRGDILAPDEPALRDALVHDEEVTFLSEADVGKRLVHLGQTLPLNLRTGRFARRRLFVLDWRRVRELVLLACLVPLLGLLMALVMLVRLNQASEDLEAETARLASAAIGQEVTAAAASGALDARIGQTPGASGSPFPPLAALYQQLQVLPGATLVSVNYRADGTLTASLAATRVEDINRLLLALQRSGHRVTATTRTGSGGQIIADLTLRSAE